MRKTAEWWGLWQAGQCMAVQWRQLPHSSCYLYQRDGAPALPDFLICQEKVEMWIFILNLSTLVFTTNLYFRHCVGIPRVANVSPLRPSTNPQISAWKTSHLQEWKSMSGLQKRAESVSATHQLCPKDQFI